MGKRKKVLVAMSGGVDSSVAACLLKEKGFEVTGVTMRLGLKAGKKKRHNFCDARAIEDAKKVSFKLGIAHFVTDFSKLLEMEIIEKFVSEYLAGKTPNPCVDCNRILKFGALHERALSLGFDFLATGHYANIGKDKSSFLLKRAKDRGKDQSYFLYAVKKDVLKSVLFPLGALTKSEVRAIAEKNKLPVAAKRESQDICFIPEGSCRGFLSQRTDPVRGGQIVTLEGEFLGEHKGATFFTIGQREGLGVGYRHPLYVLSKDMTRNLLVVGERNDLVSCGLIAGGVNLLVNGFPKKAVAKIRYNHKEVKCRVSLGPGRKRLKVIFEEPQEAVTPGQSVVLYDGDVVLGGGVIEEAIRR